VIPPPPQAAGNAGISGIPRISLIRDLLVAPGIPVDGSDPPFYQAKDSLGCQGLKGNWMTVPAELKKNLPGNSPASRAPTSSPVQ
jgi:hypothetical protein